MPEEVWVAAVALAEVHGAYATSKRVEIGYDGLRSRLSMPETRSRLGVKRRAKSAAPSFIDLPAPTLFGGSLAQPTVEVTRRDGAKLAMRLGTADARDVMGLVREFLGGRS